MEIDFDLLVRPEINWGNTPQTDPAVGSSAICRETNCFLLQGALRSIGSQTNSDQTAWGVPTQNLTITQIS